MLGFFKRTTLSDRQEAAVQKTFEHLRTLRRNRFRILACIDGSDESYTNVRFAARLGRREECDIIVLYVRPIDQGLHSGGLQVRLARQNMMDAGFELPGVRHLKKALDVLKEEGQSRLTIRTPGGILLAILRSSTAAPRDRP
jgi:nucleotide-binding universal stress UspA family protein